MAPGTEFARDFCTEIGPLQLGVVLVYFLVESFTSVCTCLPVCVNVYHHRAVQLIDTHISGTQTPNVFFFDKYHN